MSNNSPQVPSGYSIGARNRTLFPCDHCVHDRRKCELQRGVPCIRCSERGRVCTVDGYDREHYRNFLIQQNGGRHPFLFDRSEGDGYLALLTLNGALCLQHLTLHFVRVGPPRAVNPQVLNQINNNQGPLVDEMLNQLYNNSP